jgi:hypothetical protein
VKIGVVPPELPKDYQVHHQVGKLNFAPEELVALPACLHAGKVPLRCPHTSKFLKPREWDRRFGHKPD